MVSKQTKPENDVLTCWRDEIDQALCRYTEAEPGCPTRLSDAIAYSVRLPGKRLRPTLTLMACEAVGGQPLDAIPAACAVEFVHVYSLIHDDLPAMDDDALRRGSPTCHVKFDEATAILAGDSLQMLAIKLLSHDLPPEVGVKCCQILSSAAGRANLVGGQADDLAAEGRFGAVPGAESVESSLEHLKSIHRRKTGALIEASLLMGGVVGGASQMQLTNLSSYGQSIGLAFQIVDDCLDEEETAEQLGKNTRKDGSRGKLTYPGLLGLDRSKAMAQQLICDAQDVIAPFEEQGSRLAELARFVVDRRK